MTEFVVEFSIDGDVFDDGPSEECSRILRALAERLETQQPCVGEMVNDGAQIAIQAADGSHIGYARVR